MEAAGRFRPPPQDHSAVRLDGKDLIHEHLRSFSGLK